MFLLIIYIFSLIYIVKRYTEPYTTVRLIFLLYLISALASLLPVLIEINTYTLQTLPTLYFISCQYILLLPLLYLKKIHYVEFYDLTKYDSYIKYLSYLLFVLGVGYIIISVPQLIFAFAFGGDLDMLRQAYYRQDMLEVGGFSIFSLFCNISIYISYFIPFLCFYYLTKGKYRMAMLLVLPSLCLPVSGFIIGEREAFIKWLGMFLLAFMFFRRDIDKRLLKRIKKWAFILATPMVFFIVAMTFSRFGKAEGGVTSSIFVYAGEQPYNFSMYFENVNQTLGGKQNFPFFLPGPEIEGQLNEKINSIYYLNVFAGIPGSFWIDFGIYTIVFCMFYSLVVFSTLKKRKQDLSLLKLILYATYLYILFIGVFYYDFRPKYHYWWLIFFIISIPLYKIYKRK